MGVNVEGWHKSFFQLDTQSPHLSTNFRTVPFLTHKSLLLHSFTKLQSGPHLTPYLMIKKKLAWINEDFSCCFKKHFCVYNFISSEYLLTIRYCLQKCERVRKLTRTYFAVEIWVEELLRKLMRPFWFGVRIASIWDAIEDRPTSSKFCAGNYSYHSWSSLQFCVGALSGGNFKVWRVLFYFVDAYLNLIHSVEPSLPFVEWDSNSNRLVFSSLPISGAEFLIPLIQILSSTAVHDVTFTNLMLWEMIVLFSRYVLTGGWAIDVTNAVTKKIMETWKLKFPPQ